MGGSDSAETMRRNNRKKRKKVKLGLGAKTQGKKRASHPSLTDAKNTARKLRKEVGDQGRVKIAECKKEEEKTDAKNGTNELPGMDSQKRETSRTDKKQL